MKKTYIVDTNVFLSDPEAVSSFEENEVVIPFTVVEEFDRHKDRQDEVGYNARETIRKISEMMKVTKDIKKGMKATEKGKLFILSIDDLKPNSNDWETKIPSELKGKDSGDNSILAFAVKYTYSFPNKKVILVSRDALLRIKSQEVDVEAEDYRKFNVISSVSKLYTGVATLETDSDLDTFYNSGYIEIGQPEKDALFPNQYVILKNGSKSGIARFTSPAEPLQKIKEYKLNPIVAKNKEQMCAIDALMNPDIKLVTLSGYSGTGKTLIAIAAGLEQTLNKKYKSLIVCKPVVAVGNDIGFLPGSKAEKLDPWIAPIKDNLKFLLSNGSKNNKEADYNLQMLFENGTIEAEAITYMRGRSIANAFIVIDESQNITQHELKTILTRAGQGSKIILTGDIDQIDANYLNSLSNGLTNAIEKFKSSGISAHITLQKGERSELATLAANTL